MSQENAANEACESYAEARSMQLRTRRMTLWLSSSQPGRRIEKKAVILRGLGGSQAGAGLHVSRSIISICFLRFAVTHTTHLSSRFADKNAIRRTRDQDYLKKHFPVAP